MDVIITRQYREKKGAGGGGTYNFISIVNGVTTGKGDPGTSTFHGDADGPKPEWEIENHTYRNTEDGKLYIFHNGVWVVYGSPDGSEGVNGTSIIFKGSFASVAELISTCGPLQDGWSYYNTGDKKSYVYYEPVWYQMTVDGVDGVDGQVAFGIVWHGDATTPDPSWEITNHVYRDTDNGYVYIYNGTAWELMVLDGNDGTDGANGQNGFNVYITYHDNPIGSTPATPSGDGTTGGWHTNPDGACFWMSQKVAASAASGSWGTPIQIRGANGTDGIDGAAGVDGTGGISILFQGSFASADALIAAKGALQVGWSYYNTTEKKSFVYYSGTWYQMTIDGVDGSAGQNGLSIIWHGTAAVPDPSWQILNHCYKDSDNGYVYIWNGTGWELMVLDGDDGVAGATGPDGWNVYITYNANAIGNPPSVPTGDGTTGGWYTNPDSYTVWMSQKVAASASAGSWGTPIRIKGDTGATGNTGPGLMFQGLFSATTVYYNNALRRDIVRYSGAYYLYRGTDGSYGAWNTGNWESFGENFNSVATDILFANLAYVDNLGVKYLNGVPVPVGDLYGSYYETQIYSNPTARVDEFTVANAPGESAMITCNGHQNLMTFDTDTATTISNFCYTNANNFGNVTLYASTYSSFIITANTAGVDFNGSSYSSNESLCTIQTITANVAGQPAIHTITLLGTGGQANIINNGLQRTIIYNVGGLSVTASNFVVACEAEYLATGSILTSNGADLIFTKTTSTPFYNEGASSITNVANIYRGAIKIEGNEIWENQEANDTYGVLSINRKGLNGYFSKYRNLLIGNGKGDIVAQMGGAPGTGYGMFNYFWGDKFIVFSTDVRLSSIPIWSSYGLVSGQIWRDQENYLRIIP